ncbi:pro-resilin-like [Palaemon carinicauda]|uniref:pro-resilin-like n=1 Tax=Palaemon carinicauda TaxID=392227 RepID=UPI0035B60E52
MYTKVALLCLVAVALARPDKQAPTGYDYAAPAPTLLQETQEGMPFDFGYAVKDDASGLDFGHNSNSDGQFTTGEYRVALPDGRTQIVTYAVDRHGGYQATVEYVGEARYPEPPTVNRGKNPAPDASYLAPTPTGQQPAGLYEAPL